MPNQRWTPKLLIMVSAIFLLAAVAACGGSDAPVAPAATEAPAKEAISSDAKPEATKAEAMEPEKDVAVITLTSTPVAAAATAAPAATGVEADYVPDWVSLGQYGGDLTMNVNRDLRHWDAHQGCCNPEGSWASIIFDSLVEKDPVDTSVIICDLCLNWETADDGLSITFKMHPKAKWQDGMPVTSQDAKYSINRMMEEGKPRPRVGVFRNYIENMETPDPETLVINFQFPNPAAFMEFMAIGYTAIMPEHVLVNSPDPDNYFDEPENLMASGPFIFESWNRGESAAAVKNENYWKEGRPFVDRVHVFVITDIGRIIGGFETGQLMKCFKTVSCSVSLKDFRALVDAMGDNGVWHLSPPIPRSLNINHTREPFTDKRVRQAVYIAIDRKKAIDVVALGEGVPGIPFPPNTFFSSPKEEWATWNGFRYVDGNGELVIDYIGRDDVVKDPADIELAKQLLADAGFPNGIDTTLEGQPSLNEWMLSLQEDFAKVGIRAELKPIDGATNAGNLASGKYNLAMFGHGLSINDPDEMLTCCYMPGGPRNQMLWENERIVDIFHAQKKETDQTNRGEMIFEVEDILRDEIGSWFPISWFKGDGMMLNKRVKNYYPPDGTIHQAMGQDHIWIEQE
jgi:peptide/nickel transport system substrate-binding protein